MTTPSPRAPLERLQSGRHRLSREDVTASQRGRLLEAIVEVVAEKGYAATTVADVVALAKVSRRTFYEHFDDKQSCFIAAFDVAVEYLLGRLTAAADDEELDWRERLRSNLETYMEVLADEPAYAFALHVEILAAGPQALRRRAEVFALFSERTRRVYELARKEDPSRPKLPAEAFAIHSGGIDDIVRDCLRERGAAALPELATPLAAATLALFEK